MMTDVITSMVSCGFEIEIGKRAGGEIVTRLFSPGGQCDSGYGDTIEDSTICALLAMVVRLEGYLVQAERGEKSALNALHVAGLMRNGLDDQERAEFMRVQDELGRRHKPIDPTLKPN